MDKPLDNSDEKIDRRTRKTKKAIRAAFMTLAASKSINEITVTEISDVADINRKTFYVYYKDVYSVVDEIEDNLIGQFVCIINKQDFKNIITDPYQMFNILTEIINEEADFHTLVANSSLVDTIFDKVKNVIRDRAISVLDGQTTVSSEMHKYVFEYVAGGLITAYKEWFRSGQTISLKDLLKQVAMLITTGINPIIR